MDWGHAETKTNDSKRHWKQIQTSWSRYGTVKVSEGKCWVTVANRQELIWVKNSWKRSRELEA